MKKPRYQPAMKHIGIALALLTLAACASAPPDPTRPQIDIAEVMGLGDQSYVRGPFDVQYELSIANPAAEPITLRRVELATTGGGGAYSLRRDPYVFKQVIAPGTRAAVRFWAHAYANYFPGDPGTTAPVSIRGIATFDSPKGGLQQVFFKVLSQFPE